MRPLFRTLRLVAVLATLTPAVAGAQQSGDDGWKFDLHPTLTKAEFTDFTADLGAMLRSRQLGDTVPLAPGKFELSVQLANNTIDDSQPAWSKTMSHGAGHLGRFMSFPRFAARVGVNNRVDIGFSGGIAPEADFGTIGVDTKIALLKQGPTHPVSVSIRPSLSALIAPSNVWAGTMGIDLSVSRSFGSVSPYAGVAATTSGAVDRSKNVDLDPANAGRALAFAGVSYAWRTLVLSGEVEQGDRTRYAFGLGTRF